MTDIDKIAGEIVDVIISEDVYGDEEHAIDRVADFLRSYGDECAKQMRYDCAHLAWQMECGGRDIKDVPEAIRAIPLPSEKVKP